MDQSLPTFGIRHLRPDEPFSLLSINESQYQATLEHHPHAALSYVDEDDGEKVTIGSSLELRQRLDDPPSLPAPSVPVYSALKDKFDDRFIHLFDIQQKDSCRVVWRNNQRKSGSAIREHAFKERRGDDNDSISYIDLNSEYDDVESEKNIVENKSLEHIVSGSTSGHHVNLLDAIPDLVDNLANLLQSTSETLRKAAAKSRTTQTSPIEDVMLGMNKIVAEVGGFGLSLLESVNIQQSGPVEKQSLSDQIPSKFSTTNSPSETWYEPEIEPEDHSSTISVVGSTLSEREQARSRRSSISREAFVRHNSQHESHTTTDLKYQKISSPTQVSHDFDVQDQPWSFTTDPIRPSSASDKDLGIGSKSIFAPALTRGNSILDQDTEDEDADFSRRYPPLMSLRRANTVAGLHNRFVEPQNSLDNDEALTRHSSWVKRYPHRPIPHVLDVDTQRRRDFAQNCFPTQKYSPGIDLQGKLPRWAQATKTRSNPPATSLESSRNTTREEIKALTHEFPPSKDVNVSLPNNKSVSGSQRAMSTFADAETNMMESLAQATKTSPSTSMINSTTTQSPVDAPPGESSGAFFHRMIRDQPLKDQDQYTNVMERPGCPRLARPKSMYLTRPNNNPFCKLDRSSTVSVTANPASRLNRPFDPFYPTTMSHSRVEPAPVPSATGTISKAHGEASKARAAQIADRASCFQRSFSPVWEDHLKPLKRANSSGTGPVEFYNKVDRNGESSSMYSPPPRHMRSVPNLALSASMTKPVASTAVSVSQASSASSLANHSTIRNSISTQEGTKPDGLTMHTIPLSSNPFRMILQPTASSSASFQTQPSPFQYVHPTNGPGPKVLPRKPAPRTGAQKISHPDRAVRECLVALQDMGYGVNDNCLRSRLHVYAEAANGDVMDAVDMIEEDQRASMPQSEGRISL